jgi:hypothetical protein
MLPSVSHGLRMATEATRHEEAGFEIAIMCSLGSLVDAAKIPIRRLLNGDFTLGNPIIALAFMDGHAVLEADTPASPVPEEGR